MPERPRLRQDVPAHYIESETGVKAIILEDLDRRLASITHEMHQRIQEARDEEHVQKLLGEYDQAIEDLRERISAYEKDVFGLGPG